MRAFPTREERVGKAIPVSRFPGNSSMQPATPPRSPADVPLMRSVSVLVLEAGPATGPDLTRYLLVCSGLIVGLLVLAWLFRRHVAGRLRARAAKRSLQVLDVLPLAGKQKLIVVRCYDRSFLLGVGEKEVRAIAELDGAPAPHASGEAFPRSGERAPFPPSASFSGELERELTVHPATPRSAPRGAGLEGGVLA